MTFIIECFRAHNFFIALKKKRLHFQAQAIRRRKLKAFFV